MEFGDFKKKYTNKETASIVILPVPYDGTSTWIKGADKGPKAIIEASPNLEFYDIETQTEVFRYGIHTADEIQEEDTPEEMIEATYMAVKQYISQGKYVVTIGGEHSVTNGPVLAYSEKYAEMTVLQLDAHSDMRQSYQGSKFNHACVMARVREICPVVQVGIRSIDKDELQYIAQDRIFWAHEIHKNQNWHEQVLSKLTKNVYLTIDLDVFDPSIMPSTGTPEPGGLGWYDVLDFVEAVSRKCNIVGFDIVELCPNAENKAPDFLAAKLIYRILSLCFTSNSNYQHIV